MTASAADPLDLFRELFARAVAQEPADPTAVTLATVDASGAPSVRIVLCKGTDTRGFLFFTNHESRKARELRGEPRAALCFYWPTIGVQLRAEGVTERLTDAESAAYFATRPRESQLGAWASRQSEPLISREELLARFSEADARFPGLVPCPPFWGGYRIVPSRVELWQVGEHRLHDRTVYERAGTGWLAQLLFP